MNGCSPDDPEWMDRIRDRVGCENLLLTLGEAGMAVQGRGRRLYAGPHRGPGCL